MGIEYDLASCIAGVLQPVPVGSERKRLCRQRSRPAKPKDMSAKTPLNVSLNPAIVRDKVLDQLRRKGGFIFVSASDLSRALGVDGDALRRALRGNKAIRESVHPGTKEVQYAFASKYKLKDSDDLLALVSDASDGVREADLKFTYPGIEEDVFTLREHARVVAVRNAEDKTTVLFPRRMRYLTRLSASVDLPGASGSKDEVNTAADLRDEVRPGDIIRINGADVRLSTRGGAAQVSCSSVKDHSTNDKYEKQNTAQTLFLHRSYSGPSCTAESAFKHGCTNDIRKMWHTSQGDLPVERRDVQDELVKAGLMKAEDVGIRQANQQQCRGNKRRAGRKKRAKRVANLTTLTNQHVDAELQRYLRTGK